MKSIIALFLSIFSINAVASLEVPPEIKGKTVTIVVPYGAGGGSDTFSRMFATKVSAMTGVSINVVNKPGAFATIGTKDVAESKPDGLTLLGAEGGPIVFNPLMKQPNYVEKDRLVTIVVTVLTPQGIFVPANSKYNTLDELLKDVKADPKKFVYGCSYNMCNLYIERILSHIGVEVTAIPYKSSPQMLVDVSTNNIQFAGSTSSDTLTLVQGGKIKPLAFGTNQRLENYPNTPLFRDSVPGFVAVNFHGLYAPAGTPKSVVEFFNRAYREVLKDPEIKEELRKRAVLYVDLDQPSAERFVNQQIQLWKPIVEKFYKP
jgi:tripartite-type tricarboxylate transporter receptor subunit TctC